MDSILPIAVRRFTLLTQFRLKTHRRLQGYRKHSLMLVLCVFSKRGSRGLVWLNQLLFVTECLVLTKPTRSIWSTAKLGTWLVGFKIGVKYHLLEQKRKNKLQTFYLKWFTIYLVIVQLLLPCRVCITAST